MIKATDAIKLVKSANEQREREIEEAKRQVFERISAFLNNRISELASQGQTQLVMGYRDLLEISFKSRTQSDQIPPKAEYADVKQYVRDSIVVSGYRCEISFDGKVNIIWGDGSMSDDNDRNQ